MLGVLPGVIGTIQATEVVKLIIGQGDPVLAEFTEQVRLNMRIHVEINHADRARVGLPIAAEQLQAERFGRVL